MTILRRTWPVCICCLLVAATSCKTFAAGLSLEGVEVIADHNVSGHSTPVPEIVDGDPETAWSSGPVSLRQAPANLFLRFPQPVAVGAVEVDTVVSKNALRLTAFEVYARVEGGWALLGEVRDNTQERITVPLVPAQVQVLRLRLRDNARVNHDYAVVSEVRVFPPAAGAPLAALAAAPVPDETAGELMFITEALGDRPPEVRAAYDPKKSLLDYVRRFADTILQYGTDRYGTVHSPMFVSILMLATKEHPGSAVPSIPGQRMGDRAMFGGNLQHDIPLLEALVALSELTGDTRYREAADAYLQFFLDNCTDTPTGLWPWGEHAHWDFYTEQPGHSLHEYLGAPPPAFWDRALRMNTPAVLRHADGLLNHVKDLETFAFCRHADINTPLPDPRPELILLDFPRHGAFFAHTWALAYNVSGEERYLGWYDRMIDYFIENRLENGALPVLGHYSYRPALRPAWGSNLTVGISILESVPLLGDIPQAHKARELGLSLLETLADQPWSPPTDPGFVTVYGGGDFAGGSGLLRMQAWKLTGDQRHLQAAQALAETYMNVESLPPDAQLRAQVYGLVIDLLMDMHEHDGDQRWLEGARRYARWGIEDLYSDGLFRGATNLPYYDSELYVSTFVYSLLRLAAAEHDPPVHLPSLYFHR